MNRTDIFYFVFFLLVSILVVPETGVALDFRIGLPFPENIREYQLMVDEAKRISIETDGEINFIFSFLTDRKKTFGEDVRDGILDGCLALESDFRALTDSSAPFVYGLPFLFTSREDVEKVRRKLDDQLLEEMGKGSVTPFSFVDFGYSYLVSTKPVDTVQQVEEIVVWAPPVDSVVTAGVKAAGFSFSVAGGKEVLNGLKEGLIDAVVAPLPLIIMKRWHTRLKHVLIWPVAYSYGIWVVSDTTLKKLSAPEKAALQNAFQALGEKLEKAIEKRNKSAEKVMKRYKANFVVPSAALALQWKRYREQGTAAHIHAYPDMAEFTKKIEQLLQD